MNKLVLKNPVLRFKLGKIIKAKFGLGRSISNKIKQAETFINLNVPAGARWTYIPYIGYRVYRSMPWGDFPERVLESTDAAVNAGIDGYNYIKEKYPKIRKLTRPAIKNGIKTTVATRINPVLGATLAGKGIIDLYNTTTTNEGVDLATWNDYKTIKRVLHNLNQNSKKLHYTNKYGQRVRNLNLNDRNAVMAILRKLGVKADGIWGDNTERAYLASLKPKVKFVPGVSSEKEDVAILNNTPSQITIDPNFVSDIINNEENNRTRLYEALNDPDIKILPSAKQGAKLVSKNPVKRFKKNKTINFMKGLH